MTLLNHPAQDNYIISCCVYDSESSNILYETRDVFLSEWQRESREDKAVDDRARAVDELVVAGQ